MLRPTCALLVGLAVLVSPALAERKWFAPPLKAEQIQEMHGPYNSADALRPAAERTPLINDRPTLAEPIAPPPAPAPVVKPKPNPEPPAAMMAEILKIRRATQTVDPAEEAEFVEALQEVAGLKKAGQAAASGTQPASPPAEQKPATQNTADHDELVKCLREAARRLDEVAANYEDLDQYPLATEARKRAEALRSDARNLNVSTFSFFMTFER